MRRFLLALGLAVLVGFLVGAFSPRESSASYGVRFYFQPPAGTSWAELHCGWHDACVEPFNPDTGLDWGPAWTAYFRFRGYNHYSPPVQEAITYNSFFMYNNVCQAVQAKIYDAFWVTHKGDMRYVHTKDPASPGFVMSARSRGVYGSAAISTMVSSEGSGCPWLGVHVHETHLNVLESFARNTSRWPNADGTGSCSWVASLSCWTRHIDW